MKLKDLMEAQKLIIEMPMVAHGVYGNLDDTEDYVNSMGKTTGSSWHKASDRKLVKHPVHIKKLEHMFARTKHNFGIFVVDDQAMKKKLTGQILNNKRNIVSQYLDSEQVDEIFNTDNRITLIVAENSQFKNDEPMTPWIYAHKLWHFIDEQDSVPSDIRSLVNKASSILGEFSKTYYGKEISGVIKHSIGTSKAFRDKTLAGDFEVANELFCQHINSGGEARLADNPSKLGLEKGNQYRLEIQDEINKLYDEILTKLAGKILFLTA
jgi:hypothetical protein